MEPERLSVIAGRLVTLESRLQQMNGDLLPETEGLRAEISELIEIVRAEERSRLQDARRLQEILDVLFCVAGLDFSKRASVGEDGLVLDELAVTTNVLSEELQKAQAALAERNRALEAATDAKSQFLANMSHEIRTPLGALLGFADLLHEPRLSEGDRLNYSLIIRRNGEHLLSLLNDLLDLSKIEAGKLTIECIAFGLAPLLGDLAALMRVRAQEAGLGFDIELQGPVPDRIYTDPTRLRQILLNLIGNAIKFTESGAVRLILSCEDGHVQFAVTDSGIGMSPEQVRRLFRPFEQADPSMTRRFGGTGLGLAISRDLAEALGGKLSVNSIQGHGSTFCFSLPADVPADVSWIHHLPETLTPSLVLATPAQLSGTVLLAEDGVDNQLYVTTLLRRRGLEVAVAENGQIAIEMALAAQQAGKAFDVILMDMQMPLVDGYSATAFLREQGYAGPIVALTAHAMAGESERCLAVGCDAYLSKSVPRQELIEQVARYVQAVPLSQPSSGRLSAESFESALRSRFEDEPEMHELISRFVSSLPNRIEQLKQAAAMPDRQPLLRLVHQLKGAAGSYGFDPVSELAARLEQALSAATSDSAERLLDELARLCRRAVAIAVRPDTQNSGTQQTLRHPGRNGI
ncbi:MAG: hypothetical protein CVV27_02875 [Candidatus Melainabacteria bacterium HGW-Melainabacteria-1]|nr:MAG: hypothetical protein CVV27_02875 [Candidatus Melainabacteria bacterium HGW-Melainabacteria-1]